MESLTKTSSEPKSQWYILSEIISVFVPALLLILMTRNWVGDDPIRGLTIIWVANILMLVMIFLGMKRRRGSFKEFGLSCSGLNLKNGLKIVGLSLVVFVIAIVAYLLGPILLSGFLDVQETADFSRYDYLKNNLSGLFISLIGVYIVSSFGEELIYRAFLINRLSEVTSKSRFTVVLAVILSSLIFGLIHYEWGIIGIIQTTCMGLAMGISYVILKKRLWILILAHAYMDTILLVQLYSSVN